MIYTYYRYYAPGEREVDTIEEAVASAFWDIEMNEAAPDLLLDDNRNIIFTHEQFREKIWEYSKEVDKMYEELRSSGGSSVG